MLRTNDRWSIGVLGRLNCLTPEIVYYPDTEGDGLATSQRSHVFMLSTMLSLTYH